MHRPPVPEPRAHVHVEHGVRREDPLHWLRDRDDPAVLGHLRAENAHTEAVTAHLASLRATREGNTVVIAARGVTVPDREALLARAANIEARHGLPARKWLKLVRPIDPALLNEPA